MPAAAGRMVPERSTTVHGAFVGLEKFTKSPSDVGLKHVKTLGV